MEATTKAQQQGRAKRNLGAEPSLLCLGLLHEHKACSATEEVLRWRN